MFSLRMILNNLNDYVTTIIILIFISLIFWLLKRKKRIEHKENIKAGLNLTSKKIKKDEKKIKKNIAGSQLDSKKTKKKKSSSGATKLAISEEKLEEKTMEIEEVTVSLVADLKNTSKKIEEIVDEKIEEEKVSEREIATIEILERKIRPLKKLNTIDKNALNYLKQHFQELSNHLEEQVKHEKINEKRQHKLIEELIDSIKNLSIISKDAKSQLNKLKKLENKEKKAFKKEMNLLRISIIKKQTKLTIEKAKGKKANKELIAQLKKEISLLKKNSKELNIIKNQLTKANKIIDKEIKKLKTIIVDVIKISLSQRRHKNKLKRKDKDIKKKLKTLQKKQEELQKEIEKHTKGEKSSEFQRLALQSSIKINSFFNYYKNIIEEEIKFITILKTISLQNIQVELKMESFLKLLEALEESEQAIEKGTEAILNIVSTIMTNDVSAKLSEQAAILETESRVLNDAKRIDKALEGLNQNIKEKSLLTEEKIEELLSKEKKYLQEQEALHQNESKHLGNSMGTVMNKKVGLDERYMQKAVKFGKQLEKSNQDAMNAYRKATDNKTFQKAA